MATVDQRVRAATAKVLRIADPDSIQLTDNFTVDLGAASVQSIELVATFEEDFGIDMEEEAALAIETVGDAITFITDVCKAQGVDVET